jgi:hypothetical protein
MHKLKSKPSSEPRATSSQLLAHIKDDQFYSTLSTIALQFARETGASQEALA